MPELRSRFAGCLLGGAIGDALGAPLEFLALDEIRRRYGRSGLTEFVPAYGRLGAITDDTQMTLFTAEGLIVASAHSPENPVGCVHEAYLRWLATQGYRTPNRALVEAPGTLLDNPELHEQRGPGRTCLTALASGEIGSVAEPINDSKGCGGIMRIAPVGLVRAAVGPSLSAFGLGCDLAALTHGHPSGYLAAGAFAEIVAGVCEHGHIKRAARQAQDALRAWPHHEECAAALERALAAAERPDEPSAETVQSLGEGWVAEEALAIAVYCAVVALDFGHGISLAANHSGDSDSTASLTGSLLGARWGREVLPGEMLDALELRATIEALAGELYEAFAPA